MEFKKFEDKLIIENIVNYCIENNISTREINSLTAKIKFGRLDENVLSELIDPFSLGVAATAGTGAAIGGAVKGAKWLYDKMSGGITLKQKYNYAIGKIQNDLQNAINSLESVESNLTDTDKSIFKKYNIVMPEDKKQELVNAVTEFKAAMEPHINAVKTTLANVGGEVSGGGSNFDTTSPLESFNFIFQDEMTALNSSGLDEKIKNSFKANFKTNVVKILSTIKDANQRENYLLNLKTQLDKALNDLKDPAAKSKGIVKLQSLVTGKVGTASPEPEAPKAATISDATIKAIIGNLSNVHDVLKNIIINTPDKLNELKQAFQNNYKEVNGKSNAVVIKDKISNSLASQPKYKNNRIPSLPDPQKEQLVNQLIQFINFELS